ncbi:flagellin [Clostridium sp. YIM B02505]|uniref:Flagellin n=1 Tax=Clostridium yunnanense TaxID=2800325 RepID=A0ABS1EU67_9CLOT|nr:flagellin [Clostridium yunnanense]MBK1812931.1 flagellin [Clostridium yunnanense]
MIINHNMNALNAHRQMTGNTAASGKSMEKLSSGLRINRAGDDAAGLAISEKMRGQIRGLDQASRNSQDAISLIQTAEGALNETHSILQRQRELAVQSANDTNVGQDRTAIQAEMNQLTQEVDRIANTTEFNTQKLLDGSFNGKKFQIGANNTQDITLSVNKMDSSSLGLVSGNTIESGATVTGASDANGRLKDGTYTVKGTNLVDASGNTVGTVGTNAITVSGGAAASITATKGTIVDGSKITISNGGDKFELKNPITGNAPKLAPGDYSISGTNVIKDGKIAGAFAGGNLTMNDGTLVTEAELGYQSGKLVSGGSFTINGADVSTRDAAQGTITSLDSAIAKVSSERSSLGAYQNRLEHTINNLGTASENLTAAESRVRDVDMAKEMMNFSKNNILSQAAQAMLAQANQQPQGVLQLLR